MAFVALEAHRALVPTEALLQDLAVFGGILENLRRSPKIAQVVGVDASFAVVAVLLGGAPGTLVHEHVEDESVFLQIQLLQIVVQVPALQQALRHKVILYAFVLEVLVDVLDVAEVGEFKRNEVIGLPCLVVGQDKGPIESVVAKQFEFICVVVASQRFLFTFHVKDVQVQVSSTPTTLGQVLTLLYSCGA
jgi:hypothetical protein